MTTITHKTPTSPGRGDWKETLGRVGLVGKGVLFGVIGLLAIQLASGDAANTTNKGAIEWIASQAFGKFLLVALTVSLFALAAWRLLDALVGDPVEGSEATDRAKYAVKGLLYLSLAIGALSATMANWSSSGSGGGSGSGSGGGSNQTAAATILEWPFGRWIVAGIGLAVIGYAIYQFKKHTMDEEFTQRLSVGSDNWITTFGRFGYGARAVIYVMVGYFFLQAAITYDPREAKGLSGALQELSGRGWGQFLLWIVAFGLVAFGIFTIAESKYRRAA